MAKHSKPRRSEYRRGGAGHLKYAGMSAWLGASVIGLGVGAALTCGSGIAQADNGARDDGPSASSTSSAHGGNPDSKQPSSAIKRRSSSTGVQTIATGHALVNARTVTRRPNELDAGQSTPSEPPPTAPAATELEVAAAPATSRRPQAVEASARSLAGVPKAAATPANPYYYPGLISVIGPYGMVVSNDRVDSYQDPNNYGKFTTVVRRSFSTAGMFVGSSPYNKILQKVVVQYNLEHYLNNQWQTVQRSPAQIGFTQTGTKAVKFGGFSFDYPPDPYALTVKSAWRITSQVWWIDPASGRTIGYTAVVPQSADIGCNNRKITCQRGNGYVWV